VIPNRALATVAVVLFVFFRPRRKYNPVHAVLKITIYLSRSRHLYRNKNYSNVSFRKVLQTWFENTSLALAEHVDKVET
jgi:hypothetical protein